MNRISRLLNIAALALMGAMMTGCSSEDNVIDKWQQVEKKDNIVTLTTTVGFNETATTRALDASGHKTFAIGDQIAVIYKNTSNQTVKAVSNALTSGGTASATFTVTLVNPATDSSVRYIYPAAMAKESIATDAAIDDAGTVNYDALVSQDGTLATLGSKFDLAIYDGKLTNGALPASATLENKLAICAYTLKDNQGTDDTSDDVDITGSITGLTFSDGTNSYAVTRSAAAGPIYVAIRPTTSANIKIFSTIGATVYKKSLTGKSYAAGNGYPISLKMDEQKLALGGFFTVNSEGKTVFFSKGNVQITGEKNFVVSWIYKFAAHQYDIIGNAEANTTIIANSTLSSYPGTVDLFGWSSNNEDHYNFYGINNSVLYSDYSGDFRDWGGNFTDPWRTPTKDEWTYLFNARSSGSTVFGTSSARYTLATINTNGSGVNGMILFPDGINIASSEVTTAGTVNSNSNFTTKCTTAQWNALEAKGCIFLPAAGKRIGVTVSNVGSEGYYWSATSETNKASGASFSSSAVAPANDYDRWNGCSVRLVQNTY